MKLRFTRPALADLENILDYIAERSPQGAKRVHARIRTILDLISQHPRIGAQTDDPIIRRAVTVPYPYLIFYEAAGQQIIIHAIRHGSRDPETMPDRD
jgi:plasmid stabilization system protein ParE